MNINWRKLLGRPEPHRHFLTWHIEPDGRQSRVFADCPCGYVAWSVAVMTTKELNDALRRAFQCNALSALGYFTAPTEIP